MAAVEAVVFGTLWLTSVKLQMNAQVFSDVKTGPEDLWPQFYGISNRNKVLMKKHAMICRKVDEI